MGDPTRPRTNSQDAPSQTARRARWIAFLGLVAALAWLAWPLVSALVDMPVTGDDAEKATDVVELPPEIPTPGPRNLDTQLTWSPGVQTWRHWYVGGSNEHLQVLGLQGFRWLKQRFAWADLEPTRGAALSASHARMYLDGAEAAAPGVKVLVQLDVPPEWALRDGPMPFDVDAWESFVLQFAERYAGRVHAYEILNEPNLAEAWGAEPDPAAYAEVLARSYRAIKSADGNALVISAGLSPTGTSMPHAMGDLEYLRGMYDAFESRSSEGYFDALGAHAPGFRAAPDVAPEEAEANPDLGGQRYFTFRRIEDLRAEMVLRGEKLKPIVVTEFGWTIDPRPESPYHWSAVSREERVAYTRDALQYAADNWSEWVGPLILFSAPDPAWSPDHEAYWRSITDHAGWLLDGLTLDGLGVRLVETLDTVDVADEVEDEREIHVQERVPLRPFDDAIEPPASTGLLHQSAPIGGAIAGAAYHDGLLAVAEGPRVAIYSVADLGSPREVAASDPFDDAVTAVALRGDTVAIVVGDKRVELLRLVDGSAALEPVATLPEPASRIELTDTSLVLWREDCVERPCRVVGATVDLGNPEAPAPSIEWPMAASAMGLAWPDVDGTLAFVPDEGDETEVGIYDVEDPEHPAELGRVSLADFPMLYWIAAEEGVLTMLVEELEWAPDDPRQEPTTLLVYDYTDPLRPVELASVPVDGFDALRDGDWLTFSRARCDSSPCDIEVVVMDLSEPADPQEISSYSLGRYPALTPLAVWDGTVAAADRGGLRVLRDAEQHGAMNRGVAQVDAVGTLSSGHAVALAGDRLQLFDAMPLIDSDGRQGSPVVGETTVENCGHIGAFSASDLAIDGSRAYVVVSNIGLAIVDLADVRAPRLTGCAYSSRLEAREVAAADGLAFFAGTWNGTINEHGLAVVDVADPGRPSVLGTLRLKSTLPSLEPAPAPEPEGVEIGDPEAPASADAIAADVPAGGYPVFEQEVAADVPAAGAGASMYNGFVVRDLAAAGDRVFVATDFEVFVVDVSVPSEPHLIGRLTTPAASVWADENQLLVAVPGSCEQCEGGLRVFDVPSEGLPTEAATIGLEGGARHVLLDGGLAWVSGPETLWLIDTATPAGPTVLDAIPATAQDLAGLADLGGHVLAAQGRDGLQVIGMRLE